MKRSKRHLIWLAGLTLLAGACASVLADAKVNPYDPILERNPFGLKPPPPPDPDAGKPPPPPPPPLATVELTGITSILSSKRALFEIVPGPGKPMIKPILSEGERVESVEVVSINVEKNEVVVKNGGITTNLTFKVAKSTPTPAGAPAPGAIPGMIPRPLIPTPPAQTSFNNNQGSGRYNVMVAGGESSAAPNAGLPALGGANPAYGGVNPNVPAIGGGTDGAFRSIPSRNVRTAAQPEADPNIARLQNFEQIEQNRALNYLKSQASGRSIPPLPPTPLTPHDAPGVNFPPLPGQR